MIYILRAFAKEVVPLAIKRYLNLQQKCSQPQGICFLAGEEQRVLQYFSAYGNAGSFPGLEIIIQCSFIQQNFYV